MSLALTGSDFTKFGFLFGEFLNLSSSEDDCPIVTVDSEVYLVCFLPLFIFSLDDLFDVD